MLGQCPRLWRGNNPRVPLRAARCGQSVLVHLAQRAERHLGMAQRGLDSLAHGARIRPHVVEAVDLTRGKAESGQVAWPIVRLRRRLRRSLPLAVISSNCIDAPLNCVSVSLMAAAAFSSNLRSGSSRWRATNSHALQPPAWPTEPWSAGALPRRRTTSQSRPRARSSRSSSEAPSPSSDPTSPDSSVTASTPCEY